MAGGALNVKGQKEQTARAVIGLGAKDQERTGFQNMAENSKFSDQEQLEIFEALLGEFSPNVLHVAGNALEAKQQFVVVVNARQCDKCGSLNLNENIVNDVCKKCQ